MVTVDAARSRTSPASAADAPDSAPGMSSNGLRVPAALTAPMRDATALRMHPQRLRALLRPYTGQLEAYEVSRLVNSPANDVPACIEPV